MGGFNNSKTDGADDKAMTPADRQAAEAAKSMSKPEREFMQRCSAVQGFDELWADIKSLAGPERDENEMTRCAWGVTRCEIGPGNMVTWARAKGWNPQKSMLQRQEWCIKWAEAISRWAVNHAKTNKVKRKADQHVNHKRRVAPQTIASILAGKRMAASVKPTPMENMFK